jgi:glutaredoxin
MTTKRILVYSMKGCGHCTNLKNKLIENKINFINKDVNIYESEYEKISKELDTQFLPLVSVDGEWLVPEKDFTTIDECVEKVSKLILI